MQHVSANPLAEYRCTCGKLLFKGALLTNSIEIKCKRCSKMTLFGNAEIGNPEQVSVLVDREDTIIEVSDSFAQLSPELQKKIRGEHVETEAFTFRKHIKDLGTSHKQQLHIYEIRKPVSLVLRDAPARNELEVYSYSAEIDRSGRYVYLSDELCELLGCEVSELMGKSVFDSFVPLDGGLYASWYSDLLPTHCAYALNPITLAAKADKEHKNLTMKAIFIPLYSDMAIMRGYTILFENSST